MYPKVRTVGNMQEDSRNDLFHWDIPQWCHLRDQSQQATPTVNQARGRQELH